MEEAQYIVDEQGNQKGVLLDVTYYRVLLDAREQQRRLEEAFEEQQETEQRLRKSEEEARERLREAEAQHKKAEEELRQAVQEAREELEDQLAAGAIAEDRARIERGEEELVPWEDVRYKIGSEYESSESS